MPGRESWPPLLPTDHAIVESIRRGAPDAEIAARVGLSIRDVKLRIERLQHRFDVPDRASLGNVDLSKAEASALTSQIPASSRPTGPDLFGTAETGGDAPTLPPETREEPQIPLEDPNEDPNPPVHSRRALIGALFAGGATIAGVGAYYLFRESGTTPLPARPDPFATNTPLPTSTPTPPPTPHPGADAIHAAPGAWNSASYPNGTEIDLEHGICFVDTATGDFEVYQPAGTAQSAEVSFGYQVSSGNDLIAASGYPFGTQESTIHRRSTGESFAWNAGALQLRTLEDDLLIFEETDNVTEFGSGNPQPSGRFHVVDGQMRPVSMIEVPPEDDDGGGFGTAVLSLARDRALLSVGSRLFVADLASGGVQRVSLPEFPGATVQDVYPLSELTWRLPGDGAEFQIVVYAHGEPSSDGPSRAVFLVPVDRDGIAGEPVPYGDAINLTIGHMITLPSPDGRFLLQAGSLRANYISTGDNNEDWAFSEVLDAESGESQFRVLSGNLLYGIGWHRRWLADSSAFIVEAQDASPELDDYGSWRQSRRLYLVAPSGDVEVVDIPTGDGTSWSNVVEPSPDNPDLFSLGRTRVWNRASGEVLGPAPGLAPQYHDPWGSESREMRFVFPVGGHGHSGSGTILAPVVERPPYRDEVELVVARSGTCLNLREAPNLESNILECLPDDTPLRVVDPDVSPLEGANGSATATTSLFAEQGVAAGDQMFVHVQAESGRNGWVAVQYLDWA